MSDDHGKASRFYIRKSRPIKSINLLTEQKWTAEISYKHIEVKGTNWDIERLSYSVWKWTYSHYCFTSKYFKG